MDKNFEWFIRADLSPYEGKYVAIAHERVVASGDDPGAVYESAKVKYPDEEVLLWKVMPAGVFVFGSSWKTFPRSWGGRTSSIGLTLHSGKRASS